MGEFCGGVRALPSLLVAANTWMRVSRAESVGISIASCPGRPKAEPGRPRRLIHAKAIPPISNSVDMAAEGGRRWLRGHATILICCCRPRPCLAVAYGRRPRAGRPIHSSDRLTLGLSGITIVPDTLEVADLMEMTAAGLLPATVGDDWVAGHWVQIIKGLRL